MSNNTNTINIDEIKTAQPVSYNQRTEIIEEHGTPREYSEIAANLREHAEWTPVEVITIASGLHGDPALHLVRVEIERDMLSGIVDKFHFLVTV